jgi:uncharacterized protein YecE (DUF72 family)
VSAVVRLGTQGWSYPDWHGVFYPPGAKQEDRLPFYGEIFDTVELDTTFYGPPKPTIARSWARHSPDHFRFAAKLPRTITHDALLRDAGVEFAEFVRSLEPLGDKLAPLLVQMPAEFQCEPERVRDLESFLAAGPAHVRFAVEFRHASWHVPATWDLLRRRNAAVAWTEWRELPRITEITADFLYLRWLGDRREIERYDRVQIDRTDSFDAWQRDLEPALGRVREVFGYFNNHWAGHSPASANEMKRRLGLLAVEPSERWPQGELF